MAGQREAAAWSTMCDEYTFRHAALVIVVQPLQLEAGELHRYPLGDGIVREKARLSMATRSLASRATVCL
jgi:hypothetical protein